MSIEMYIDYILDCFRQIDTGVHLNERYLHHMFSYKIQQDYPVSFNGQSLLHPEWATYVKDVRSGGQYQRIGNKFVPTNSSGSSGFIDFAIGNVEKPDYAVEFKMSMHFNKEGLIYDYMKLLDNRNQFGKALSIAVYYGHSSHSRLCDIEVLTSCIEEAVERLEAFYKYRPHRFIFIEIVKGEINRHLECNNNLEFVEVF